MGFVEEINRRKTFGIVSHPDAGKDYSNREVTFIWCAIQNCRCVKSNKIKKSATSDFMEIEKQRVSLLRLPLWDSSTEI